MTDEQRQALKMLADSSRGVTEERHICANGGDYLNTRVIREWPVEAAVSSSGNDRLRALKIARDGGIEPATIEIVVKDGTVFRV